MTPPYPDPNASRGLAAGQHYWPLDPTHAYHQREYGNEYDQDFADQEPEQSRRDSRTYHPGGMGIEWEMDQAARAAQEVAENLAKEQRRAEREARRAAEERAATNHRRRASGHHHHHVVAPTPLGKFLLLLVHRYRSSIRYSLVAAVIVSPTPEGYVPQQQRTHARYLEEQVEREREQGRRRGLNR